MDAVVQLGHNLQAGKAGLAAAVCIKGADAHQAVHAVFALQQAVGVGAFHHNAAALHAGLIAVLIVQRGDLEAVGSRPAVVHTEQHIRPVLRLGSAGAGMKGEDGVVLVILTAQQGDHLQLVNGLGHLVHALLGLGDHLGGVLFLAQQQHGVGIVVQAGQLAVALQLALQVADLRKHLLAGFGIVIKARLAHFVLQLGHTLFAGRDGQGLAQVLHSSLVFAQLRFQFVNGNHISAPF